MNDEFNVTLDLNKKQADAEINFNDKIKLLDDAKEQALEAGDNYVAATREYAWHLIGYEGKE